MMAVKFWPKKSRCPTTEGGGTMDPSTSHMDRAMNAEKNRFLMSVYSREEGRQSREDLWRNYGLRVPSRSRTRALQRSLVDRTATRLGFGSSLSAEKSAGGDSCQSGRASIGLGLLSAP